MHYSENTTSTETVSILLTNLNPHVLGNTKPEAKEVSQRLVLKLKLALYSWQLSIC